MMGSIIQGSSKVQEAEKLMEEFLISKCKGDREQFLNEWVNFDLNDNDAVDNVWDLLNDFCLFGGYARLKGARVSDQISQEVFCQGTPIRGKFFLQHFVQPAKRCWRYTHGMKGRCVNIAIHTSKTRRLVGRLDNFRVVLDGFSISCNKDMISVEPSAGHE